MMQLLFPTPVFRTQLGLTDEERQVLMDKTLAVYGELNSKRKPWSRSTRESLESWFLMFCMFGKHSKQVCQTLRDKTSCGHCFCSHQGLGQ